MINTTKTKPSGLNRQALRTWGMIFLLAGVAGAFIRNCVLGLGSVSTAELLQAMQEETATMVYSTLALVLQAAETCATPIFAFLLVEGFRHTSNFKNYLLRVLGIAVLAEIPFNLVAYGKVFAMGSRNPVFGLVLCLVALYFFRQYGQKKVSHVAIKIAVTLAAIVWAELLNIEHGTCCVILTGVLWGLREKPQMQVFIGCLAAICCSVISLYYMAAPMAFLAIHFYNGEQGEGNKWVNYLAYPVILLVVAIVGLVVA